MQTLQTTSLRVEANQFWILDQQALPQQKNWLPADSVEALVGHIHALRVRGAPLIGLSASLLLALLAERGESREALAAALETLRAARPTAAHRGQPDEQSRSHAYRAGAARPRDGPGDGSAAAGGGGQGAV